MAALKFKITEYAMNDSQIVVPKFDEPKYSEEFTSYSMLVTHNGEDKYWSISPINKDKIQDFANMKNGGKWKGMAMSISRQAGEKGKCFTKIDLASGDQSPVSPVQAKEIFKKEPTYTPITDEYLFDHKHKELGIISQVMLKIVSEKESLSAESIDKSIKMAQYFLQEVNKIKL